MRHTLQELAEHLNAGGADCQVVGDGGVEVSAVATLEDACAGQISFLANPKYEKMLATTQASAVVVGRRVDAPEGLNLLRVADPYAAITRLIVRMHGQRSHPQWGVSKAAVVSDAARIGARANIAPQVTIADDVVIGDDVTIYPGCFVGPGCRLGNSVVLFPNVVLYDGSILGDRVTIHAGTVVGNDGLGYAPVGEKWEKIPQIGYVEIGDDVEIGSNCSIDRATLGKTMIGSGTKFSNLIAIGHGAKIDRDCMFVAQVGLAGSVTVGRHVTMAGQAGVVGHVTIGDNVQVGAKSGVTNDVEAGTRVLGAPAMPIYEAKRVLAVMTHLPEMRDRLRQLEAEVAELRKRLTDDGRSR